VDDLFAFDAGVRAETGPFAGVDEAGRGPLAGPLVACAVVLPPRFRLPGLADSKKLSDSRRRALAPVIRNGAESLGTGVVSSDEIDRLGMATAVRLAFQRAMEPVASDGLVFLVDGNPVAGLGHPCRFLVKGDSLSASVAAAGVVAKVTRDDMLLKLHEKYPLYGFAGHKGYGCRSHMEAIRKHGPCPAHRMSFAPMKHWFGNDAGGLFQIPSVNPGRLAEDFAAEWLTGNGWGVRERNWRTRYGEVDIIAVRDGTAAFVEVKHALQGREHLALSKVDAIRRKRLAAAASEWLAVSGFRGDCRFDVLLVTGLPGSFHGEVFENAFMV
jgi:ribonuclease HII